MPWKHTLTNSRAEEGRNFNQKPCFQSLFIFCNSPCLIINTFVKSYCSFMIKLGSKLNRWWTEDPQIHANHTHGAVDFPKAKVANLILSINSTDWWLGHLPTLPGERQGKNKNFGKVSKQGTHSKTEVTELNKNHPGQVNSWPWGRK